jgi:predicted ATPase/serine/threonine protein kinase
MDPQRHVLVKRIFLAACECDPADRAAYLDDACGGDDALRGEVEALLARHMPTGTSPEKTTLTLDESRRTRNLAPEIADGFVLDGQYRLDEEIGAGGMGRVYRATQLALDRNVAVKIIAPRAKAKLKAVHRFEREARTVARLRHPHIVTIFDSGSEPELGAYLVMELLEGRSLADEIRARRALPIDDVCEVMRQVCSAVHAAHGAGIVHRDLKPDNVFLERGNRLTAKVLDFGIAKHFGGDAAAVSLTADGAMLGTPYYMSPEQCRADELDARADVYSLGCMLYEMLTGRPPFTSESLGALIAMHLTERPRPPSQLVEGLSANVDAVVLKALEKHPTARFATAAELAESLLSAALRPPSVVRPDSSQGQVPSERANDEERGTEEKGRRTADKGQRTTDNLPAQMTSFVGREEQVREVAEMLSTCRIVTLGGPGGIGKTRLALAVAREARRRFDDGVCLVELASVADPALVPSAVARAAGVSEEAGRSLVETLLGALKNRSLLLVLDNCEHVVGSCAHLTESLLRACGRVRVLATSREILNIAGEAVFAVPTLSMPDVAGPGAPETLERFESVRLFVERARLARHDFELTEANAASVAELSRKLEGIPLAIELAAARVRVLSVEQILAKMRDRLRLLGGGERRGHERQRTMRAAVDWSYELLDDAEQALLRCLSIFAGGCRLEEAEAVCGGTSVLDGITSLVDKSLLVRPDGAYGEPRFRMLEVVREYGLERLRAAGEAEAVARRHSEVFLALAEAAEPEFAGARAAEWLSRLEESHDNLRAALAWLLDHDPDACVRLAAALRNLWSYHGHYTEGRRWLEAALERGSDAPSSSRMNALRGAANLAWQQGDPAARGLFEECLRIAKAVGDSFQTAWSNYGIGKVAALGGDLQAARSHLTECLEIGRSLEDGTLKAQSLNSLGEVERQMGDLEAARACYGESLENCRGRGNVNGACVALLNLGAVAWEVGDVADAGACYREALSVARDLGHKAFVAGSLDGLGAVAATCGDWARAGRLAGAAGALLDTIGYELAPGDKAIRDRYLAEIRAALGENGLESALAEGRAMTMEEAAKLASEA